MALAGKELALWVLQLDALFVFVGYSYPEATRMKEALLKMMAKSLDLDPETAGWLDVARVLGLKESASLGKIVDAFYERKIVAE